VFFFFLAFLCFLFVCRNVNTTDVFPIITSACFFVVTSHYLESDRANILSSFFSPALNKGTGNTHSKMISRKRIVQLVRTARRAAAASRNQQNYGESKDVAGGTIEKRRRCLLLMFVFASSLDRTVDRFVSLSRHK